MFCTPTSFYPQKIDDMVFFQDNNLESAEIINQYNELVQQGRYTEANNYINEQDKVYGFFADYFNLIENRIFNLQKHLLGKPPKKQPFIYYNEEARFPLINLHMFDNNDIEEDITSILLFSDQDKQEPIEGLYYFTGEEGEPPVVNEDTIWI